MWSKQSDRVLGMNFLKEAPGSLTMNSRMAKNFSTTLISAGPSLRMISVNCSLVKNVKNVWMAQEQAGWERCRICLFTLVT